MKNEHSHCKWSLTALHIVRDYNCMLCGNEITKTKTLNIGISLAHLVGEFKQWTCFKCNTCEKIFGQNCSLAVHKRIHTGSRPYFCVLCQRNFVTIAGLKLHKKIRCSGGKKFTIMKTKQNEISVPVTRSKTNKLVKSKKLVGETSKSYVSSGRKLKERKIGAVDGNVVENKVSKKSRQSVDHSQNTEIKEEENKSAKPKQQLLQKQTDMSPFVQTTNGCLSDSVKETSDDRSKDDVKNFGLQPSQKHECGIESEINLTATNNLKVLSVLCEHNDPSDVENISNSASLNSSEKAMVDEPPIKKNKPAVKKDDPETNKDKKIVNKNDPLVPNVDKMSESGDDCGSLDNFKVTTKDHKYNTRHVDPQKSYKKLLPWLKNERKKIKVCKCTLCPHSFFSKESLEAHLLEHKKNRIEEYQCNICKKMFPNKSKMEVHKQIHSENKPFSCVDCDLSFSSKEKLDVHNKIHTGEKPYKCDCCSKEFRCRTYLKQHLRIHRSGKDYRCSTCDRGFPTEKFLKNHVTNAQIQTCHICKKSFCSAPQLNAHVKEHGEDYPYRCELCKKKFKVQNNYLLHCRIKHNVGDEPLAKKYSCDMCPTTFYKLQQMRIHKENVHNKVKEAFFVVCPWNHCGRKFTSEKRLDIHVRSHNGEKSYLCYKCGVNFKDYVYFRKHRARCLQKRKGAFKCDICGTVLTEMGSLRVHKRIHTGEKPYQCDLCGTWFRTPSHLRRHKLIHQRNKDRPIRRRIKTEVPMSNTFMVKTEKEDVDDVSVMTADVRHLDQLEFIATGEPCDSEDRKPIFDTTGVQTVAAPDVNELLFASQIVQEVMATSHIKKEPNETHYIVISQESDAHDENQQITYLSQEEYGLLSDSQVTYITQGQHISDEQITFITQGQQIISPDGQITYVTEAEDVSTTDHVSQEIIGDVLELQGSSAHDDNITLTLETSNEGDHTRYVVVNPDV